MLRNIIFDFGGVLLDWNPHYLYDNYFGTIEESTHFIDDIMGQGWHDDGDSGNPMREVVARWSARHPQYAEAFQLYVDEYPKTVRGEIPGMYGLVSALKGAGFHVWGLSNWSVENFERICPLYPILDLLEDRVVSGYVHTMKPFPEIYRLAIRQFGIRPEESLFIDDRQVNVDGAEAVGLPAVLFRGAARLAEALRSEFGVDLPAAR